jgi:hypothetical protein
MYGCAGWYGKEKSGIETNRAEAPGDAARRMQVICVVCFIILWSGHTYTHVGGKEKR